MAFVAQELSNTAWSCAVLDLFHLPVLLWWPSFASVSLHMFDIQPIANTAWSIATLEDKNQGPLLAAISSAALPPTRKFDSDGLSITVWSFARMLYFLSCAACSVSVGFSSELWWICPLSCANTAWSLSHSGLDHVALGGAILAERVCLTCEFSSHAQAHIAWAFDALTCVAALCGLRASAYFLDWALTSSVNGKVWADHANLL